MRKKSILFVDDEPNILSGLRRMFRALRNEKDFHFVESGKAALDFMAQTPVDVIVSDMRMPGMEGIELLKIMVARHPEVVRFVLSGHADRVAAGEAAAKGCE